MQSQGRGHLRGDWRQQNHEFQHKEATVDQGVAGTKVLRKGELGMLKNDGGRVLEWIYKVKNGWWKDGKLATRFLRHPKPPSRLQGSSVPRWHNLPTLTLNFPALGLGYSSPRGSSPYNPDILVTCFFFLILLCW